MKKADNFIQEVTIDEAWELREDEPDNQLEVHEKLAQDDDPMYQLSLQIGEFLWAVV